VPYAKIKWGCTINLYVPQDNLPAFFGFGYPVSRYEPEAEDGDVRIFRYVSVS
jgi:hypothetical protein